MKQPTEMRDQVLEPPAEQFLPEEVYAVPEGDWIVLSADAQRVVTHHRDLKTALDMARTKGENDGVLMQAYGLRAHWVI